jgi:hypothetical protein
VRLHATAEKQDRSETEELPEFPLQTGGRVFTPAGIAVKDKQFP